MSWNAPKDKSPWQGGGEGNKPPQNQQQPPDLEEMFRKLFSKFNEAMGGKPSRPSANWQTPKGFGGLLGLGLGILAVIYTLSGIFIVAPAERAVITQFGKYIETVGPGPHWVPRFIRSEQKVDVSQVMSSQHSGFMLTTDQNIVSLELAVQYRVDNPEAFLFNVKDPIASMQQATDSAMRQVVGAETLERILTTGRAEIRQEITDNITAMLQKYNSGLALVDVAMQPAKVPEPVKGAFDDVIKALEDKDRMENQAKAYSTRMVEVARGQAARSMQEAEAYRTQVESQATGEANRFNAVLTEYRKAPAIMRERLYLQTMQQILSNTSKVLIDTNMGNNLIYLPLDKIMENARTAAHPSVVGNETATAKTGTESTPGTASSTTSNNTTRSRSER